MILESDLSLVGKVNKTHGIDGEMSMTFFDDNVMDIVDVDTCLLFKIDGIFVPFFVDGVRPRGNDSLLVSLDGEDDQQAASAFVGMDVYMRRTDLPEVDDESSDGLYAAQLIGCKAVVNGSTEIGEIIDVDDSTDNPLFIVDRSDKDSTVYIPIVDEFIEDIDLEKKVVSFDLPEGLLDL